MLVCTVDLPHFREPCRFCLVRRYRASLGDPVSAKAVYLAFPDLAQQPGVGQCGAEPHSRKTADFGQADIHACPVLISNGRTTPLRCEVPLVGLMQKIDP